MGPDSKNDAELIRQEASPASALTPTETRIWDEPKMRTTERGGTPEFDPPIPPDDDVHWPTIECAQANFQAFAEAIQLPYFKLSLNVQKQENHFVRAEITNYPLTWLKRYRRCGYANVDPEPEMVREMWAPFPWDELKVRTPAARRLFEDAAMHGLADGFTMPMYSSSGECAALTLAGPRMPKRVEERWALYFSAYRFQCIAFSALRRLLRTASIPTPKDHLTERQRHILYFLMQGLSVKSIARQLGLHTRTIDDGLRRACLRLGVASREQAIVRALATRQIDATSLAPQVAPTVVYYVQSHGDPLLPP